MPRTYKRVSEVKRLQIVTLRASKHSFSVISKRTKIKLSTVKAVYNKYRFAHIIGDRHRGGRPTILTVEDRAQLVEKVESKEITTTRELAEYCAEHLGKVVSYQTVGRVLRNANLRSLRKIPKPLLTEEHKFNRLQFAQLYTQWSEDDWKHVIFSDETKIVSIPLHHGTRVWTTPTEGLNPDLVVPRVHSEGVNIMIWACITFYGLHNVVSIEGHLTGESYVDILNEHLLPVISGYFHDQEYFFQQDNSSIHTSNVVKNFFNAQEIQTIQWPAYSPDLNIIENFWVILKRRINQEDRAYNKEQLWNNISASMEDLWNEKTTSMIQNLFKSMPRRLQAVIEANGGHTKY